MPRQSAEARGAAAFRSGGAPLEPPKHLSKEAAALWLAVTACKPPDWFDPASAVLLEEFCEVATHLRAAPAPGAAARGRRLDRSRGDGAALAAGGRAAHHAGDEAALDPAGDCQSQKRPVDRARLTGAQAQRVAGPDLSSGASSELFEQEHFGIRANGRPRLERLVRAPREFVPSHTPPSPLDPVRREVKCGPNDRAE
jgi:hypothetical protein